MIYSYIPLSCPQYAISNKPLSDSNKLKSILYNYVFSNDVYNDTVMFNKLHLF